MSQAPWSESGLGSLSDEPTGATLGLVMSRKMANFVSMNAENTIKSLIPQSIIDDIPSEKKVRAAALAAHKHHLENNHTHVL